MACFCALPLQVLAVRGSDPRQQLEVLGELMLQSHASYGACGLGSQGTDRLVELVLQEKAAAEAAGQEPALFGAKITGGGCGGELCKAYALDTALGCGRRPPYLATEQSRLPWSLD